MNWMGPRLKLWLTAIVAVACKQSPSSPTFSSETAESVTTPAEPSTTLRDDKAEASQLPANLVGIWYGDLSDADGVSRWVNIEFHADGRLVMKSLVFRGPFGGEVDYASKIEAQVALERANAPIDQGEPLALNLSSLTVQHHPHQPAPMAKALAPFLREHQTIELRGQRLYWGDPSTLNGGRPQYTLRTPWFREPLVNSSALAAQWAEQWPPPSR